MMAGPCLADSEGVLRIRKLKDRARHIDNQIAELQDKKSLILYEIEKMEGS